MNTSCLRLVFFWVFFFVWAGYVAAASISNVWVEIQADEKTGVCRFVDKTRKETVVDGLCPVFDQTCFSDTGRTLACRSESVEGVFGAGERLTLTSEKPGETRLHVAFTLYAAYPFVDISWGVENKGAAPLVVKQVEMLNGATVFDAQAEKPNLCVLDGNGGGTPTRVTHGASDESLNNLLVTFGTEGKTRRSVVIGGLTYHDFVKWAAVDENEGRLRLRLFAPDAIGKRIDPGQIYLSPDRFYVDFITDNPFEALERYGIALRNAQAIRLNPYTFPTVCLWYLNCQMYGGGQTGTNDTLGAVAEMARVARSGFLNYSTVAIRLVPDCYGYNNQQSWWDDAHWALYGSAFHTPVQGPHYKKPYETTAKWAGAVREMGGIPLTYMQTNWRSEDYAKQFPGHMLYNRSYAWKKAFDTYAETFPKSVLLTKRCYAREERPEESNDVPPDLHGEDYRACRERNNALWGQDFTDPGFQAHIREVYGNLKNGGVEGLMFDYPYSAWTLGGLEDRYSTSAAAYRKVFELAYEGLGPVCWIHERCTTKGTDIALGLVASQRTMGDNDRLSRKSVTIGGLRWYKNRVVTSYDADSKGLQFEDRDTLRRILTMSYVTQGRLVLATSFGTMTRETLHDLSRTFPYHTQPKSARPTDAFIHEVPCVYDFAVDPSWHLLTLYNDSDKEPKTLDVPLSGDTCFGALGLDADKRYYGYDFWNDAFLGSVSGAGRLVQTLRPSEARMLALHEVRDYPQFLSTDRHIMQGYNDLSRVAWDAQANTLNGVASVVAGEPYRIVVALNGYKAVSCSVDGGSCALEKVAGQDGLVKLCLNADRTISLQWTLRCQ